MLGFGHRFDVVVMSIYFGGYNNKNENAGSDSFYPKFCSAILQNISKPLSSVLNNIWFVINGQNAGIYYGDSYCALGKKCLRSMELSEINNLCSQCNNNHSSCAIISEY